MKMSLTTEERNISNGVQSISRMMLFGCLVAVIFTFAAEAKPATNWPQITRRGFHPLYKCTGKLRIACARVASECHVPVVQRKKEDIISWMRSAANEIGRSERRRHNREAVKFQLELSPNLIQRFYDMESEHLRYSENQWFRVKVSCKRCDHLCWM